MDPTPEALIAYVLYGMLLGARSGASRSCSRKGWTVVSKGRATTPVVAPSRNGATTAVGPGVPTVPEVARAPSRIVPAAAAGKDTPAYNPRIREIPPEERPRERLQKYGPAALATAELIAIIWRSGTRRQNVLTLATHALAQFGALPRLAQASAGELSQLPGVGPAKAVELLAAFELGRRLMTMQPEERMAVRSPEDIANLLMPEMAIFEQEHLRVALLDTKHRVAAIREVYVGSLNASPIRVGELFRDAVRQNSAAIIIVHNHPSGDPTPSPDDVQVTRDTYRAGQLLDIELLDHIIIGAQRFVSLKARGLGFSETPA